MRAEDWLQWKIAAMSTESEEVLQIPTRDDGKEYCVRHLYKDQKIIVAEVMAKLQEWLTCEDFSTFRPLRMTIVGAGGCGKSVVINTIVTLMRNMFGYNDVVKVAAPTGTAAFNINGQTLHNMLGMRVSKDEHVSNNLNRTKRMELLKRFKTLLALIVDERSLLCSKDLGTSERLISETIFSGRPLSQYTFGGLPIVLLVGDDYQLPSIAPGAFFVFSDSTPSGRPEQIVFNASTTVTQRGKFVFLECGENVMALEGNKRVKDSANNDRILLEKLRVADDLDDAESERLLNLGIEAMEKKHGKAVTDAIKAKAIYVSFANKVRKKHNTEEVAKIVNNANPIAIIRPGGSSNTTGKPDSRHFDGTSPKACVICKGAKVMLFGRNFAPQLGLHVGAMGTVEEIIFAKGHSPNRGNRPEYVVVNFPLYRGPPWDPDSPQVSKNRSFN